MSVPCAVWVTTTSNMLRVEDQRAYLLHLRPYRDTSAIVDLLTVDYGRVSMVARGVRKNKTPKRQLLNPFHELLVSFQGDGELKLLTQFESANLYYHLTANHLYSGFYLNELLIRLLPEMDPHNQLFSLYEQSLQGLNQQDEIEPILRCFEFTLLQELGYAISFTHQANHVDTIEVDRLYACDLQQGFFEVTNPNEYSLAIQGQDILAIERNDYQLASTRRAAKLLSRFLLKPLLGNRPLKSRELFSKN